MVARKNKRRSSDAVQFELHWEANCVNLYNDIINHNLYPTAYAFIVEQPKYRGIFASDFSTRILHHYIDIRLRPLIEKRLTTHTYNNRKGYGQVACQNAVITDIYDVSKGFTKDAWIIKLDIKGCFPNIIQDIAYKQLEDVILNDYDGYDKDELLYILNICIYSYPTLHCDKRSSREKWQYISIDKSLFCKPLGVGAAIGHLIWQNAVNYYFNKIDKWMLSLGISYERFVDDMYIITDNKEMVNTYIIPELRLRLYELGAKLNESKHYCQHYTKGCECLGTHIKMDRVYVNNRIVKRATLKAKSFNRVVESKINKMLTTINSYLGTCKNVNGYGKACEIVNSLDKRWFDYVYFDRETITLRAKDGYKFNQLLTKRYKL